MGRHSPTTHQVFAQSCLMEGLIVDDLPTGTFYGAVSRVSRIRLDRLDQQKVASSSSSGSGAYTRNWRFIICSASGRWASSSHPSYSELAQSSGAGVLLVSFATSVHSSLDNFTTTTEHSSDDHAFQHYPCSRLRHRVRGTRARVLRRVRRPRRGRRALRARGGNVAVPREACLLRLRARRARRRGAAARPRVPRPQRRGQAFEHEVRVRLRTAQAILRRRLRALRPRRTLHEREPLGAPWWRELGQSEACEEAYEEPAVNVSNVAVRRADGARLLCHCVFVA
ncbi:hypothetical protein DAEQUDRAFT_814422 [Daedalea quercina L-15889]|uniref:Uncharacterized protein n=1 Tax=Daedalea quercina L-15889 TaxID=1314783 RepID=A0A165M618_9APHY|nr:hypothetical protein DAEQUDRAFT_814422 [Daedalea quercina L-15889]